MPKFKVGDRVRVTKERISRMMYQHSKKLYEKNSFIVEEIDFKYAYINNGLEFY